MRLIREIRKKPITSFLIPSLCILAFAVCMGWAAQFIVFQAMKEEVVQNNLSQLKQTQSVIDRRFEEIETITFQIMNNSNISNFQYVENPFQNVYQVLKTRKQLFPYPLLNHFISQYYILFKRSGVAMSSGGVTYRLPSFYESTFSYRHLNYDEWYALFMETHHSRNVLGSAPVAWNNEKREMLVYVHSMGDRRVLNGAIIILIDQEKINELFYQLNLGDTGWAYIESSDGGVVSKLGNIQDDEAASFVFQHKEGAFEKTIKGERFTVTYVTSPQNRWRYVVVQSSDIVLSKVQSIRLINIAVFTVLITIGALFSFWMAMMNSRQLKQLISKLVFPFMDQQDVGKNAIDHIYRRVESLLDTTAGLQKELEEQMLLLRAQFFERLLTSGFMSKDEMEAMFHRLHLDFIGDGYVVCVIRIAEQSNYKLSREKQKVVIKNVLLQAAPYRLYFHEVDMNHIAVIVAVEESKNKPADFILSVFKHAQTVLRDEYEVVVNISTGKLYEKLMDMNRSFLEANHAMELLTYNPELTSICYDTIQLTQQPSEFTPELERKLLQWIRSGSIEDVEGLFQQWRTLHFANSPLNLGYMKMWLYSLLGSVTRSFEETTAGNTDGREAAYDVIIEELERNNFIKAFELLHCECIGISRHYFDRKKSKKEQLKVNMLELVHSLYQDPGLNLAMVSEHLDISEVYLSNYFKEQVGEMFSEYVEKLRMGKAKQLLLQENCSVNEISEQIGYNSAHSFRRAFKRYYGLSPKELREGYKHK